MFDGYDEEVDSSHVDDCSSSLPLVDSRVVCTSCLLGGSELGW